MDSSLPTNSQNVGPSSGSAQMQSDMREQKPTRTSTESTESSEPELSVMRHELENANAKIKDLRRLVEEVKVAEQRAHNDWNKTENNWNMYYQKTFQELERTKEVLNQTWRDKKEWEAKAGQLETQLDACQNTLFNLQPEDRTTDSQICEDWKKLCARISNWIDNDSGDKEGPVLSSKRLRDGKYNPKSIGHYWGPDRLHLADQYPEILPDLVCYNIHELLYEEILGEGVELLGLSLEETKMINSVEQGLRRIKPQRDPSSIDLWKSEAMNAMSMQPDFKEQQSKAAEKITQKAQSFLAPVLPSLDHEGMVSFYEDVVAIAINLATDIRLSTKKYYFSFDTGPSSQRTSSSLSPLSISGSRLYLRDLERYRVRNVGTGKLLKPNKFPIDVRDAAIGECISLVEPALYRRRIGGEDTILQKAHVLATLLEPPRSNTGKLAKLINSFIG